MNILVACEFSGVVREAFRAKGHNAYSCDYLPNTNDLVTGPHLQGRVEWFLDPKWQKSHVGVKWDMMIAHPPCTYLTISAEWAYKEPHEINKRLDPRKLYGARRLKARMKALKFVEYLWQQDIDKVCIENPVGVINRFIPSMPKPQYIQPYEFGHDASKKTGLWLRNLPSLEPTSFVQPRVVNGLKRWANQTDSGQNRLPPSENRWKERSKTYAGIAEAMADQWG